MLFKEIVDARTHGRTHGRRTPDIEGSQKLTEHFVLRWAKNYWKKIKITKIIKISKHGDMYQHMHIMFIHVNYK